MIQVLIFDADHTLLEFDDDEKRAFALAFADFGVTLSPEDCSACRDYSYACWAELGLNDVHKREIQQSYHDLYRGYVPVLCAELCRRYGVERHERGVTEKFLEYLSLPSHLIGGAKDTLSRLRGRYRICIATNGLKDMQTSRLTELLPYTERLFISEEFSCIKPQREFFERMTRELGVSPQDCLMIGDSLSSDVAGAVAVGMKSCWFNRFALPNEKPFSPDYEISAIEQVEELLIT